MVQLGHEQVTRLFLSQWQHDIAIEALVWGGSLVWQATLVPACPHAITQVTYLLIQEPNLGIRQACVVMWGMWVVIYLVDKGLISAFLSLKIITNELHVSVL